MPNRMLRDGILSSEAVNSLNWAEEVFYRRLMSVVDDFGRYYASPKLLRAACYPLHIDKVSDSDIGKWLTACVTAALVRVYPASDGKSYLELLNFRQQVRAKNSKFPQMSSACVADATQMSRTSEASAHLDVDEDVDDISGRRFDEFWESWPKNERKQDRKKCRERWVGKSLDSLADKIIADVALRKQGKKWADPQFIEAPLVYLNNQRWEDEYSPNASKPAAQERMPWN